MALLFREKPTHHLITKGDDGFLTVNKKKFGECKTLHEVCLKFQIIGNFLSYFTQVVTYLSVQRPGWPVLLTTPINDPSKAAPPSSSEADAAVTAKMDETKRQLGAMTRDIGTLRKKTEEEKKKLDELSSAPADLSSLQPYEQAVASKFVHFVADAKVHSTPHLQEQQP